MNWIRQYILVELTRQSTRRYSQLRPDGVEGNLFAYHLERLMKEGLVERSDRAYRLSVKGRQYAGTLSLDTGRTRQQPKILTAVVARNEQDEYLLVRWHREPNTDLISFPHGMVHFGRTIGEMAAVELAEKAGLEADLRYMGEVYVRGMRDHEVDRHMLVHLFEATNWRPGRQDELRPEVCEHFWAGLDTWEPNQFVPGFYEIAQIVRDSGGQSIFAELDVPVD
jgi:ADP-ribose pyrophosphatase YjhB (NUDIX family)